MQKKFLVVLVLIAGLSTTITQARHNITAALVALAPVADTGLGTRLDVNNEDGNAGSTCSLNWILLATTVLVQFLLNLRRWRWINTKDNFLGFGSTLTSRLPHRWFLTYFLLEQVSKVTKEPSGVKCSNDWREWHGHYTNNESTSGNF